MVDADDETDRGRTLRIVGWGVGGLTVMFAAVGFLIGHFEDGGSWSPMGMVAFGIILLLAALCAWRFVLALRTPSTAAPLNPRERLNRNVLVASGALGGLLSLVLIFAGSDFPRERVDIFSSAPLPPAVALVLVLMTGVLLPALTFFWHRRASDEVERDAHRTGAVWAIYVYSIGAPVWWFAWRGGFAPEPNDVLIFLVTVMTMSVVMLWKRL